MSTVGKTLSTEERMELAERASAFPSINAAAEALGYHRTTVRKAIEWAAGRRTGPRITFPDIPDDDIPTEDELRLAASRFEKRLANAQARDWQTIKVDTSEPIVLAFVGDPHIDDNGCNLPLLLNHVKLLQEPNVFAVNIGDTTNNWTGRLMRLYANQDASVSTARKRARWLLRDAGIRWLVWVMGNHDEWENGTEILRGMNTRKIVMEDWQARFTVEFPTGLAVPVWAAHDFKGHSQFNKLHAAMRTARERRGAAIYVCGHKHDWAVHHEEIPDTGETFWALRARGYKFLDSYSAKLGFASSRYGATVAAVIDPRETDNPLKAVTCFADLQQAINYRRAL